MRCHFCNESDTAVVDTRSYDELNIVRRTRRCNHCDKKFTTYEIYVKEKKQRKGKPVIKPTTDIYKQIKRDYGDEMEDYLEFP